MSIGVYDLHNVFVVSIKAVRNKKKNVSIKHIVVEFRNRHDVETELIMSWAVHGLCDD